MSFVILRTSKLKTAGEIGGSLGHTFRIMKTPNADKSKLHLNEHEFSLNQIKQNIKDRLPEKVRKNGVRVVEYLITASPEWTGWGTEKKKNFFDNAKNGLEINMALKMLQVFRFIVMKQRLILLLMLYQLMEKVI